MVIDIIFEFICFIFILLSRESDGGAIFWTNPNPFRSSGGLRFWGALCKIFGEPLPLFFVEHAKIFRAPSKRKCCDSDMLRVYRYSNWRQIVSV